jgi:hypothetical protein
MYNVNYFPDRGVDCMSPAFGITIGVLNVTSTTGHNHGDYTIPGLGNSSPTGSITGTGPGGAASVCVSTASGSFGNQVSITII